MKIVKQNIGLIFLYLAIFFSVTMVMQFASGKSESKLYQNTAIDIGVVDNDDSVLSQGLIDHLKTIHNVVLMENDPELLQENLFYRNVEYIIQIPKDFYGCLKKGETLSITKVPGSYSSYYVDQQISSYLNALRTYLAAGFSQEEAITAVNAQTHEPVTILPSDSGLSQNSSLIYYFRYIPYLFLGALCYTMGYILMAFKKGDIQKRMAASALSSRRQTLESLAAVGVIGFALWAVGILGAVVFYRNDFLGSGVKLYYLLNTMLMLLVSLALSYLIGIFITNSNLLSGVANLVSLAMCFLCGVFVPMDVMDASVLKFSQFLPVYWYEQVNEIINRHSILSGELFQKVWAGLGIQMLFFLVFLFLILAVSKYRKEG